MAIGQDECRSRGDSLNSNSVVIGPQLQEQHIPLLVTISHGRFHNNVLLIGVHSFEDVEYHTKLGTTSFLFKRVRLGGGPHASQH